jgi:hypothetical protein
MAKPDEELLTANQVAKLIGKSPRTVLRMVEAGLLASAHKLPGPNGAYLFRTADVLAFVLEDTSARAS